jgi:hypothetical protein
MDTVSAVLWTACLSLAVYGLYSAYNLHKCLQYISSTLDELKKEDKE